MTKKLHHTSAVKVTPWSSNKSHRCCARIIRSHSPGGADLHSVNGCVTTPCVKNVRPFWGTVPSITLPLVSEINSRLLSVNHAISPILNHLVPWLALLPPTHHFRRPSTLTPGLKPSFSANISHRSLLFFFSRTDSTDFPDCCRYFWGYQLLLFSFFSTVLLFGFVR